MSNLPDFLQDCTAFKFRKKQDEVNGSVKARKATKKELEAYKGIKPSKEDVKFVYNKAMRRSVCK